MVGRRATSNPESNAIHATRIKFGREALGRQSIARWFDLEFMAENPK
jgi:hypothetical protein